MPEILRLEYFGEGIYRHSIAPLFTREALKGGVKHPVPSNDLKLCDWWNRHPNIRYQYYCGFRNEEQLFDWFPLFGLREMIWHIQKDSDHIPKYPEIVVYEISSGYLRLGEYQIMFKKKEAKEISRTPLNEWVLAKQVDELDGELCNA